MVALHEDNSPVAVFRVRPTVRLPVLRLRVAPREFHATLMRMLNAWQAWQDDRRTRALLAGADERLLRDCAFGRADAVTEAEKPLWQP